MKKNIVKPFYCGIPVNFIFAYLIILFSSFQATAQWIITTPECVSYDATYNRYLVSCFYTGKVVIIDSNGIQSNFKTGLGYCYGSTIYENVFYISTGKTIRGYNLSSGALVMTVNIPSAHQLDGMTADSAGNIYIADFHYGGSNDQIYKLNTATQNYWIYIPPGHGLQECPQDIEYDKTKNRLLVVSCYQTPILAINLADSSISTVFSSSTVCNFDGIAQDSERNFYATSWQTGYVYKFDPNFTNTPEAIEGPFNGPSNLCYNPDANILAIPVFNSDTVIFHSLGPIGINNQSEAVNDFVLYQNYPNPFNPTTTLSFHIPKTAYIKISVFEIIGNLIEVVFEGKINSGKHSFLWNGTNYPSGVYIYKIETENSSQSKKMVLIK